MRVVHLAETLMDAEEDYPTSYSSLPHSQSIFSRGRAATVFEGGEAFCTSSLSFTEKSRALEQSRIRPYCGHFVDVLGNLGWWKTKFRHASNPAIPLLRNS